MFGQRRRVTRRKSDLKWEEAPDIKVALEEIVGVLEFDHVPIEQITCYRTTGSAARAYARIWSMPKIFQQALNIKPHYVIEVLSQYFDRISEDEQKKVLIHELLHIPKNFSGSLIPHTTAHKKISIETNKLFKQYMNERGKL